MFGNLPFITIDYKCKYRAFYIKNRKTIFRFLEDAGALRGTYHGSMLSEYHEGPPCIVLHMPTLGGFLPRSFLKVPTLAKPRWAFFPT